MTLHNTVQLTVLLFVLIIILFILYLYIEDKLINYDKRRIS